MSNDNTDDEREGYIPGACAAKIRARGLQPRAHDAATAPKVAGANDKLLERIDIKAEAGLCAGTFAGAREFLKDVRVIVSEARAALSATSPAPAAASEMLNCGHHKTLAVMSAESGDFLYCELCDARSGRADAEAMETELRSKLAESEETCKQLVRALREAIEGPTFMGEPVLPAAASRPAVTPAAVPVAKAVASRAVGGGGLARQTWPRSNRHNL
jgi:hypothetical protein